MYVYIYICVYIYIERERERDMYIYIYIYIYTYVRADVHAHARIRVRPVFGTGDDTVGNPHRAQISQFELFELILLLKLDKRLPVERFEATVSQSTVPSPL